VDLSIVATVGAIVAFGIARVVYSDFLSRDARVKRRLAGRARVSIGEAQEGLVRLTGRARPIGELLRAPVSQRPCVAFQIVARMRRNGKGPWTTVMELEEACPFILADKSGQAVIDTAAGPFSMSLVPNRRGSSSPFRADSADLRIVRALLRSRDIETETVFGRERGVWFTEAALLPEATVSVSGHCAREVALDGERTGYRDLPQRLIMQGTAGEPLLISNWRGALEEPGS
jgi:hypothetical protein